MIMRTLCCLLLAATLSVTTVFAAPVGTVTKCSGTVSYRMRDHVPYKPLKVSQVIDEGGWLKTGKDGWIELVLTDKSRFTIANNSELELARLRISEKKREGLFNLTGGKLRATIQKMPGLQSSLEVRSKTAVAGIKGTEFLMLSQGPANVFFGNEGHVSVSGLDDKSQGLGPRAMTQTTRGYAPTEPVMVEPNTPLAAAKQDFDAITAAAPPEEWLAGDNLPVIIARWNVNHGRYLADSGKYDQALQVFQVALDLTADQAIRCDARLERGAVYSRFLANPEAALAENLLVLEEYPKAPQSETALFNAGQILFDLSLKEQARERFRSYLQKYPQGKHKGNVETLLRLLEK